jgi:hypothetical protein
MEITMEFKAKGSSFGGGEPGFKTSVPSNPTVNSDPSFPNNLPSFKSPDFRNSIRKPEEIVKISEQVFEPKVILAHRCPICHGNKFIFVDCHCTKKQVGFVFEKTDPNPDCITCSGIGIKTECCSNCKSTGMF